MKRRGFTLAELMLTMALSLLLLGAGAWLLGSSLARARCDTHTMAERIAEQFRLARQEAITTQNTVVVNIPTRGAHAAHSQMIRVLHGSHVHDIDFNRDFPGGELFVGFWPLDPDQLPDHTVDNNHDGCAAPGNSLSSSMVVGLDDKDFAFYYSPNGTLSSNGIVNFKRGYHLVVAQGVEYRFAPAPPSKSPPAKVPYCVLERAYRPVTVTLYGSGLVSVENGVVNAAPGSVKLATRPIANLPPPIFGGVPEPGEDPQISELSYRPPVNQSSLKLDGLPNSVALIDEGALLSLQVRALDQDASWVTLSWNISPGGAPHTLHMERRGSGWTGSVAWQAPVATVPVAEAKPSDTPTPGAPAKKLPPDFRLNSYTLEMQLTDNLGRQVTPNAQAISVRAAGRCFFYGESNGESWLQATDPSGTWSRPVARGVSGLLGLGGPAVDYDTIAPSPDGTRVAFRGVDGIINVCNREGLGLRVFNSGSGDHRDLKWSPDGSRLAYTEDSGNSPKVWLASADGSCAHQLVDGSQARWAPDGKSLSVVMQDPAGTVLKVVKLDPSGNATGEPVLISGTGPIHNFGWVGERAFYSQSSPGQPLAYLQSGGPSVKTENWNVSASEAACSATQVAFVDGKSENLYCLTPESKSVALIREDKCSHPCWSPSGSQLVFNCRVGYSLGICRIDADGRNFLTISHGSKDQVYPHWVK